MKTIIIILILILVLLMCIKRYGLKQNKVETFKNNIKIHTNKYLELPETYIETNGKPWTNMTLEQCQDKCNNDENCNGFIRDYIDKENYGQCSPIKSEFERCNTIRKGNEKQRDLASKHITYLKSFIKPNKCLGIKNITLDINVCIKSIALPFNYLTILDNNVYMKKINNNNNIEFHKHCEFILTKGLEGSGTVSFRLTDNNGIDYYLTHSNNKLNILPINSNTSTLNERVSASYNLIDGLSDKNKISIKTFSFTNNSKFLYVSKLNKVKPVIRIVSNKFVKDIKNKKDLEYLTFDIIDSITKSEVISVDDNVEKYHELKKYPENIRKDIYGREMFQSPTQADIQLVKEEIGFERYKFKDDDYYLPHQDIYLDDNSNLDDYEVKYEDLLKKYKNITENKNMELLEKEREINKVNIDVKKTIDDIQLRNLANEYYFLKSKM